MLIKTNLMDLKPQIKIPNPLDKYFKTNNKKSEENTKLYL